MVVVMVMVYIYEKHTYEKTKKKRKRNKRRRSKRRRSITGQEEGDIRKKQEGWEEKNGGKEEME